MEYTLVNTKYRCHCGTGFYLGYKFYPQPFFLLQLAGKLRRDGHKVILLDLFHNREEAYPEGNNIVYHIGEYAADSRFKPPEMRVGVGAVFSGTYPWLHREEYEGRLIEPGDVFGDYPALDLIDLANYPTPEGRKRAVIRLSLGCPNKCIFCPVPVIYKGKYRRFNPQFATRLIEDLAIKWRVREISLMDDNLFADIELGKELLRWIISRGLDVRFCLQEGFEVKQVADYDFCSLLKKAGFYDIRIGVETLDAEALRYVNKNYSSPQMAVDAISNIKKVGFAPLVFLVDGISKDPEQNARDIKVFEAMGCGVRNHKLLRYDNTPLAKEGDKQGRLL